MLYTLGERDVIRLSSLQQRILSALDDNSLGTQREIAEATGSYQSSISRSIRRLMDAGLVTHGEAGYEITLDGSKLLSERMAERTSTPIQPGAVLSREATHLPLTELRRVQEQLAALHKPAADILRVYSRMRPLFEELENTGSPIASLDHCQRDFAEHLRLAAIPSIAIRLMGAGQVNKQINRILKEVVANQARIAERLTQVTAQADFASGTWVMEAMLPSAKAVEAMAQLAVVQLKVPQPVGAHILLKAVRTSLAHYQRFALDILAKVAETWTKQALLPLSEVKLGGQILQEAIAPLRSIPLNIAPRHSLIDVTPNFYSVFGRQAAAIPWDPTVLTEEEVQVELESLPSVKIADAGLSLVRTRVQCNKRAQLIGQELPFRPTVDTELISVMLPQTTVMDEREFREFIDWLYKYVYESSGDLKRLLAYLPEEDCQVAFVVKFLRRYYFHDLEHGSDREAQKKYRAVGGIFQERIGRPYPETCDHWQTVQLCLLNDLHAMLLRLLSYLITKGPRDEMVNLSS